MANKDVQEGAGCFLVCLGIALVILSIGGCQMLIAKGTGLDQRQDVEKKP